MEHFHGARRWLLPSRSSDWLVVPSIGADSQELERNRVPDVFVTSSLEHLLTTSAARTLYAMYEALGGGSSLGLSGPERGRYEARLKQRLADAFTHGELVALEVERPVFVAPAWNEPVLELPREEPIPEPTWLAIELKDAEGRPVPRARYVVTLPDGSTREGTLNKNGYARVDGVNPGKCHVSFPELEAENWS